MDGRRELIARQTTHEHLALGLEVARGFDRHPNSQATQQLAKQCDCVGVGGPCA